MMSKKYYSISEVADILGVKAHNLRYLDALLGKKLTRIRGRRYYQLKDIDILRKNLEVVSPEIAVETSPKIIKHSDNKIDSMLYRLEALKKQLEAV
jgi:DNA-binding transcriptional MerR regulator